MKERCRRGKVGSDWEEEKRDFFKEKGIEIEEVERKREREKKGQEKIEK